MYRFIAAVLLCCAACGVGTAPPPEGGSDSVGKGVQASCPNPADPDVDYVSQDPLACAAAFFACAPTQTTFNDSCGCGCIGPAQQTPPPPPPPVCPDPADPNVHYVSQSVATCSVSLIGCAAGQTAFNDSCGCGCIGPVAPACPNPADPKVHYISQDPLKCAAILFQCNANQTSFSDGCGCGCID